jgi:amidase
MASIDRDLAFTPAVELVRLYRARKVSPLEVTQAALARIDAVNPQVNAFVTVAREAALWEARRATAAMRRGKALPPLFGVPVGIKDVTQTKGILTTYGSTLFKDHVPEVDALVVERLKAAGAIVLGKTNTPEFAFGPNTVNAVFGATRNPWNLARTAGGSSGGSAAALATGMCPIAEGTDLGGSLRGPAAHCGVVGCRTTPGLIPRYPSVLAWDTYSVEGPMARTVADAALMLSVMAGPDPRSPISYAVDTRELARAAQAPWVKGWRIAWTPDLGGLVSVDGVVREVFEDAVSALGDAGARVEAACPDMSEVPEIVRLSRGFLMVARHGDKLPRHRDVLQAGLVENTEQGLALTAADVARGELLRTTLWNRVREFLDGRDLWVTPTTAMAPFPLEQPVLGRSFLTYAFSVLGLPAISVPAGFTRDGLPIGLQIVGKRGGEAAVLRAAAAFETARPWAHRVPPVVPGPR